MKTFKKSQSLLIAISLIIATVLFSCKKKDDAAETPTPAPANGTIAFHMHTNLDTVEVEDYDSVYTMSDGRKISVTKAQLYLSNIQLVKLDGSTYNLDGVVKLKKKEIEEYVLASVPSGNYQTVKFNIGLDSATNATTPAQADSTLNQPAMWFGSSAQPSGFVYVVFEGMIDTTAMANGSTAQMQPFSYEIGTNMNLQTVTMPNQAYTVLPNQTQFVHMTIDYNMLFMGVSLNNSGNLTMNTTSANATALGMLLSNNIQRMFGYEM